jgi:hypothetical protein
VTRLRKMLPEELQARNIPHAITSAQSKILFDDSTVRRTVWACGICKAVGIAQPFSTPLSVVSTLAVTRSVGDRGWPVNR